MFTNCLKASYIKLLSVMIFLVCVGCATPYEKLRDAINSNDIQKAERSLSEGANPNEWIAKAVKSGSTEMVSLLLKRGADSNFAYESYLIEEVFAVNKATNEKIRFKTKYDYKHKAHKIEADNPNAETDILSGFIKGIYKFQYDIKSLEGRTPIFYAIDKNDIAMVQLLLNNGSNLKKQYVTKCANPLPNSSFSPQIIINMQRCIDTLNGNTRYFIKTAVGYESNTLPIMGEKYSAIDYAKINKRTEILNLMIDNNQP